VVSNEIGNYCVPSQKGAQGKEGDVYDLHECVASFCPAGGRDDCLSLPLFL